jgi:hypothetical protein
MPVPVFGAPYPAPPGFWTLAKLLHAVEGLIARTFKAHIPLAVLIGSLAPGMHEEDRGTDN